MKNVSLKDLFHLKTDLKSSMSRTVSKKAFLSASGSKNPFGFKMDNSLHLRLRLLATLSSFFPIPAFVFA